MFTHYSMIKAIDLTFFCVEISFKHCKDGNLLSFTLSTRCSCHFVYMKLHANYVLKKNHTFMPYFLSAITTDMLVYS